MSTTDATPTQATVSLDEVVASFADLPTLAPVAVQVIRLADDENASMADLAAAISVDPGLSARLLRLANSAMYAQTKQVTNLDRATALLGLRTVKLLSLGFSLVANLNSGAIDTSIIWRRSLAGSVLARRMATETDKRLADDAFVAGLLSNTGKLALAEHGAYIEAVRANGPWMDQEQELAALGFTSDEATGQILTAWGLPDIMSTVIARRMDPPDERPAAQLAGILQASDAAARLLLEDDDEGRAAALDAAERSAGQHLEMGLDQLETLIHEVSPELDEIASMFDFEAIASTPINELMLMAKTKMAQLSLDTASALSHEQQRNQALASDNERLAAEASTDPLTGLPNRRTFQAYLTNQVDGRVRKPRSSALGVIMLDLDHFKSINDNFGHGVGDEVLQGTGARISEATRRGELSARIGGEEFAVILPDVSPEELTKAAERFRALIGDEPIDTSLGPLSVTASVGAAYALDLAQGAGSALVASADSALYASKNAGRNRVSVVPMTVGSTPHIN